MSLKLFEGFLFGGRFVCGHFLSELFGEQDKHFLDGVVVAETGKVFGAEICLTDAFVRNVWSAAKVVFDERFYLKLAELLFAAGRVARYFDVSDTLANAVDKFYGDDVVANAGGISCRIAGVLVESAIPLAAFVHGLAQAGEGRGREREADGGEDGGCFHGRGF